MKSDLVVQSFGFEKYLPIGSIDAVIEFLVNWDVDEIIVIDIDASKESRCISPRLIERISNKCFVPLTVGGGVKNIDQVTQLINNGADKIVLNSVVIENPEFVTKIANKYGRQFVTVSIDAKKEKDGKYMCYINNALDATNQEVSKFAKYVESIGAGEIFINSIDRDGSRLGYDLELLNLVSSSVRIPVIGCGGVGKASHLADAIEKGGCQAASAANIFNHTELSTVAGKAIMKKHGIPIRIDSTVSYKDFDFDHLDRPL
jgi:cyclase